MRKKLHPDAVVIAGDIYDKSVPSGEAVTVFDDFITGLSRIVPAIPILIISGNHDSARRLDYASRLLGSHQIYIARKSAGNGGGTSAEDHAAGRIRRCSFLAPAVPDARICAGTVRRRTSRELYCRGQGRIRA